MATFNPTKRFLVFRKDSASSITPLVGSKDPSRYEYSSFAFPSSNLKEALDELFRLTTPPRPEYELFYLTTSSLNTTFTVPSGITEVLVLLINGGYNGTTTAGSGGEAWSFYASVTPGQKISVKLNNSNKGNAAASFAGYGQRETFVPQENRLFNSKAGNGASPASLAGAGGGGFWVENGDLIFQPQYHDEIAAKWLAIALTADPIGAPTNASATTPGKCWPNTSVTGSPPVSSITSGRGSDYGGGGGAERSGGSVGNPGKGGSPFIAVFWGSKIRPEGVTTPPLIISNEEPTNVYQP